MVDRVIAMEEGTRAYLLAPIVRDQITVTRGEVVFDGAPLAGMRPYEVIRRGVGYVPEDRRVFASLSVLENLRVPRHVRNNFV